MGLSGGKQAMPDCDTCRRFRVETARITALVERAMVTHARVTGLRAHQRRVEAAQSRHWALERGR